MASFVAEALAASGEPGKEQTQPDLAKLSSQSGELKAEIHMFLKSVYQDFDAWLDKSCMLSKRVEQLNQLLISTSATLQMEIQASPTSPEYEQISCELDRVDSTLMVLDRFLVAHACLQRFSNSIAVKAFEECSKCLAEMANLLRQLEDVSGLEVLKALRVEHTLQKESLKHSLTSEWNQRVLVSQPGQVTDHIGDHFSHQAARHAADGLLICVEVRDLGRQPTLETLVFALHAEGMLEIRLKPLCSAFLLACDWVLDGELTVSVTFDSSAIAHKLEIVQEKAREATIPAPAAVYKTIGKMLQALNNSLFSLPLDNTQSLFLMHKFGSVVSSGLVAKIVKCCLAPSVPSNYGDLDKYREAVGLTEKFESSLVKIHFLPGSNRSLTDYIGNIDVLFANKKCQQILAGARRLMKAELHAMAKLVPGDDPSLWSAYIARSPDEQSVMDRPESVEVQIAALSENTLKFPSCAVSESTVKLLEYAHSMLEEASCCNNAQCCAQIFYGVRSMLELYTSIVPEYHKKSIEGLPQVSALYYNNCMYLSHQLITLANQYKGKLAVVMGDATALTFVDLVPLIRAHGTEAFMDQIRQQRDALLESLRLAKGFKSMELFNQYQGASQAIKQCVHQLQHLSHVWLGVLPHSNYCKSIGYLINAVLQEIINGITALEDLSSDDTSKLLVLLAQVCDSVPQLFPGDKGTSLGRLHKHCASWTKFLELRLILESSLQDIVDRWADGKGPLAAEFTPETVKALVRSLFQNTDRRSAALSKIC